MEKDQTSCSTSPFRNLIQGSKLNQLKLFWKVLCSRDGSYADKHANNVASSGPIKPKMSFFCPLLSAKMRLLDRSIAIR